MLLLLNCRDKKYCDKKFMTVRHKWKVKPIKVQSKTSITLPYINGNMLFHINLPNGYTLTKIQCPYIYK